MKKHLRKQTEKGITLIILVVTIVVILILAAITVSVSMDENGIFKTAEKLQNDIETEITGKEEELNQLASNLAEGGIVNKLLDGNVLDNTIGEDETKPPLPPKVQASGTEGEKGYYRSEVEIQVTANDRADTLTYTVEGTGIEQGNVSTETSIGNGQTIKITKDGSYTITVYEYNRNGQKSEGTVLQIIRDTIEPTGMITITKIEETAFTVQLVANDPEPSAGLASETPYTFYYKEEGSTTWTKAGKGASSSYTYTGLKEHTPYQLKAEMTDKAGNTGTSNEIQNAITGETDTTKPEIENIEIHGPEVMKEGGQVTVILTPSETVTIDPDKILLTGDGNEGATKEITQNPDGTITIVITGGTGNGTIGIELQPGALVDVAGNTSEMFQKQPILQIDNTSPIVTISPETNTIAKSVEVIINITDSGSGISEDNEYSYRLSKSETNPLEGEPVTGSYIPGTPFTIGEDLTGTYYLYIPTIQDKVGNSSIENISGYYKVGPYTFDNTAPTITSLVTSNPKSKGFTITIQAEDNSGGSGLAEENTYAIYYKTSKATGYTTPVTTADTTYTFSNLAPTIEDADITQDQANEPYLQEGMNPVIWVDLNGNGVIDEATEEIVKYTNLTTKTINPKWTDNDGDNIWAVYNNCTVTYDVYVTAIDKLGNMSNPSQTVQQTITPPIDHKTSHFANVRMEEDGSYFTWIPRYAYKITEQAPSTEPSVENTGYINTKFIEGFGSTAYDGTECSIATSNIDTTTQYVVHPAFCEEVDMGGYGTNLSGIWVAKYESSMETNGIHTEVSDKTIGDVATNDTIKVVSKPNVSSWRNVTTGKCYTNGYHYNRKLDSHMMKNSEWGAMAYITHSQYGRNGNEVTINNSLTFITGNAGDTVSAEGVNDIANAYNTTKGRLASVTGNIYGIYDMSGGTFEFVTAWNLSGNILDAGSNYASSDGKSTKYATAYDNHTESSYPTIEKGILGDAIYEVNLNPGTSLKAWFSDHSYNVWTGQSFFCRGGFSWDTEESGIFASGRNNGDAGMDVGYRIILPGAQQLPTDGSWSDEKGVNTPQVSGSLNPVMWIDKNGNGTIEIDTEEIKKYSNITTKAINPEWTENNGDENWYDYTDNGQTLESKMDHKQSKWANVIDEDTGSYFVWIPRYAYKITPTTDPTPSATNAGIIDVKFVKNNTAETADGATATIATSNIDTTTQYVVHPSFCEDANLGGYETNLYGMWVAKYEASQEKDGVHVQTEDTTTGNRVEDTIKPVSKPNVTSWRWITVGNCYINAFQYNRDMDSHLMKNSEWGATAYLTHSQYGRNGNEVSMNNSSHYYTGKSAGAPGNSDTTTSDMGTYAYNTEKGMLASTTGNITGIYDMSGGAHEYSASFNSIDTNGSIEKNGWSGLTTNTMSSRYATKYTSDNKKPSSQNCIIGDATYEINTNLEQDGFSWFHDYNYSAYSLSPFFARGEYYNQGLMTGIFATDLTDAHADANRSFRIVLPGTGMQEKDTTRPVVTISTSNTEGVVKTSNIIISITDPGYSSGLAGGNSYHYYLSPSETNPRAEGYVEGDYINGTAFTIGNQLNGTYYLYVQQIFDNNGNKSTANIIENGIGYHQVGPYQFDNQTPTIINISNPSSRYIKNEQIATYTITTSENVVIANSAKVSITGKGSTGCTVDITGSGTTWLATVAGGVGDGTITLNLEEGLFQDVAGNVNEASVASGELIIDNTSPIMTVSPSSGNVAKTRTITVTIADSGSGLENSNILQYYLSTSSTNPTETGYQTGTYTSGTAFTIGSKLTGTYYLFLPVVSDNVGNTSTAIVENYYRCGTYIFDNSEPVIANVILNSVTKTGFKVTIEAQDIGNAGLATENAYTIYYKQTGENDYKNIVSTNNIYTISGLSPQTQYASSVTDTSNEPVLSSDMNPVIWVNGVEILKYSNLSTKTINTTWTSNKGDSIWNNYKRIDVSYEVYVIAKDTLGNTSGKSKTMKISLPNTIDHKTSQWGNVKLTDGSYFVWIPRFAYKITKAPSTTPSNTNTGTIDVKFINGTGKTAYDGTSCTIATSNVNSTTQYIVHPAFCTNVNMGGFGKETAGIWVAKYEASNNNNSPQFIPNKTSWRTLSIGGMYDAGKAYKTTLNSHQMKNSEWGATAYLAHSVYGRNANEVTINNSSNYITGNGGNTVTAGAISGTANAYNTAKGILASTTGNIYGIYDMSGGAFEYVASFNNLANGYSYTPSYGWEGLSESSVSDKWATKYKNGESNAPTSAGCILGDGIYELTVGSSRAWFNDDNHVSYKAYPFIIRGSVYNAGSAAGIFASTYGDGWANWGKASFRVVLIN